MTDDTSIPETSGADDIVRYSFLVVFATDKVIDEEELAMLEKLALRDGPVLDEEERKVLGAIFARVDKSAMDPAVQAEIDEFKGKHHIP